jgi:hypothetical protein
MEEPRQANQLDVYAERLRQQLPAAPPALNDAYMQWAPWIAIVFGVLGMLISVLGMLMGAVLAPFLLLAGAEGVFAGSLAFMALVVLLISCGVQTFAGYLMLQRTATGWWLLAVSLVLSALSALLGYNVIALIFIVAIAYIHLQVKPSYTS